VTALENNGKIVPFRTGLGRLQPFHFVLSIMQGLF
jgi:hypothetical protein